jgi:putative 2-oxoglutarate-Fe(II)-dependent oxygenase superfamily protein
MGTELEWLWPTPIGIHQYPRAAEVNQLLISTFADGRAALERQRGVEPGAPFFASDDDLLQRVKLAEWQDFVSFVVSGIGTTVQGANTDAWAGQVADLQVGFLGMWFQVSRDGAFHDIHTHGNCSWSGVYIVQIDDELRRVQHPIYGAANGVTRLYGPHFATLGGAFVDLGNAYLQPPHVDVSPRVGQMLLFPSWLAHKAMPYAGALDRVIISFNATVHGVGGDQLHEYGAA